MVLEYINVSVFTLLRRSNTTFEQSPVGSCSNTVYLSPEALLRRFYYINIMDIRYCPCKKPAETDFQHLGPLCKECFADVVHKRCRKAAKDAGWLKPGQKVHISDDTALKTLFQQVFKGLPVEHVEADKADVIIVGKTADDEAEDFLQQLFAGKLENKPKAMNLFALLTTAELEKYCELEHIEGKKQEKSELRTRLEVLDKRYPGTFFALQKSKDSFQKQ
jgi:hypothetical protein